MEVYVVPGSCEVKGAGRESRTEKKDQGHQTVDEIYCCLFWCCRVMGLHTLGRDAQGAYFVSWRGIIPAVIMTNLCLACLVLMMVQLIIMPLPYWFMVITISIGCGHAFCIFVYVQTSRNANAMMVYMKSLKRLPGKRIRPPFIVILTTVLYPLVIALSTYALIPEWNVAIPSVFFTSSVPAILDSYMGVFISIFTEALKTLEQDVRRQSSWVTADVLAVSSQWMVVSQILGKHNKVFRMTVLMRLVMLMVQMMVYMFIIWALRTYYGSCVPLLLITLVPLAEVSLRFHCLCLMGDRLQHADEGLVKAVREAAYRSSTAYPPKQALNILCTRLEARPARVEVWGMDSLSCSTFVSLVGLELTYLLVLIQFCPKDDFDCVGTGDNLYFDRFNSCFENESNDKSYFGSQMTNDSTINPFD